MIGTKVRKQFVDRKTGKLEWYDGEVTKEDYADPDGDGKVIFVQYSDGDREWCVHQIVALVASSA